MQTGEGARITTQMDAAQAAEIVVLAVGWPAMETVAQNLGSLDGKIVIDMSMPVEQVARIVAAMGLDPVEAGPLRLSREIEALQRLYMAPFVQHRAAAWEPYFRRSYFWECIWIDEYSEPVADAEDRAEFPETQGLARDCPGL